jgi:hypothetical protein
MFTKPKKGRLIAYPFLVLQGSWKEDDTRADSSDN